LGNGTTVRRAVEDCLLAIISLTTLAELDKHQKLYQHSRSVESR
jgi:hypothetical protein